MQPIQNVKNAKLLADSTEETISELDENNLIVGLELKLSVTNLDKQAAMTLVRKIKQALSCFREEQILDRIVIPVNVNLNSESEELTKEMDKHFKAKVDALKEKNTKFDQEFFSIGKKKLYAKLGIEDTVEEGKSE